MDLWVEFLSLNLPNEPHGVPVPVIPIECTDPRLFMLHHQIQNLADDIGQRMAYKLWIKQRVQMCISTNNNEFEGLVIANDDRLPDAEAIVDAKILTLMPNDQMIGDTPETYEARKRVEFMMSGNISWVLLDPEIVVPNIPSNAPPNAVIA
jgi:hypothetical protein